MHKGPLLLTLSLLGACTAVHYEAPDFGRKAGGHQRIAVLPFEMIFSGKVPAGLSARQIEEIEEGESIAFQWALYNRLLNRSSAHRRRPIRIEIQPVETTNRLLAEHEIGVRESWRMPAAELAAMLEVDAVVRTSVEKTRYLSELASYGLDVGLQVLDQATRGGAAPWVPPGILKTHDIWADSSLLDGESGAVLWRVGVHRATDWRRPANEAVAGITKRLARKFPYRA